MQQRWETRRYDCGIDGMAVVLENVEIGHCPKCGEETEGIPDILDLHKTIAMQLVDKTGRLTPKEIEFLRCYLGLTITQFARRMGVTRAAAHRWENATNPLAMKTSTERFLRLMVACGSSDQDPLGRIDAWGVGTQEPIQLCLRSEQHKWLLSGHGAKN